MNTLNALIGLDWPRMVKYFSAFITLQTFLLLAFAGLGSPGLTTDGRFGFIRLTVIWLALAILLYVCGRVLQRLDRPLATALVTVPLLFAAMTFLFAQISEDEMTLTSAVFLCSMLIPPFLFAAISPFTAEERRQGEHRINRLGGFTD